MASEIVDRGRRRCRRLKISAKAGLKLLLKITSGLVVREGDEEGDREEKVRMALRVKIADGI